MYLEFSDTEKRSLAAFDRLLDENRRLTAKRRTMDTSAIYVKNTALILLPYTEDRQDLGPMALMVRSTGRKRTYNFPGGVIDKGETPIEAMVREYIEETSQSFPEILFSLKYPYLNYRHRDGTFTRIYVAMLKEGTVPYQGPIITNETNWVGFQELYVAADLPGAYPNPVDKLPMRTFERNSLRVVMNDWLRDHYTASNFKIPFSIYK